MRVNETVEEFIARAVSEAKFDVDVDFCEKHGIKYDNHEIDAKTIDLFDTKSNKEAFNFIFESKSH